MLRSLKLGKGKDGPAKDQDGRLRDSNADTGLIQSSVADMIFDYLRQLGIEYVFGVPGGAIEPLCNALARAGRSGGPRFVTARHEAGAAFMADGYARETGNLGVCLGTSGPGATNLLTGVASAYENHVPILAITGQTALKTFGRRGIQESSCTGIDVVGMFRFCTSYDSLVSNVAQAEHKLAGAVMRAMQTRRPAHLSIPFDIQQAALPRRAALYNLDRLRFRPVPVDEFAREELECLLEKAERPIFVIGGGCRMAARSIVRLAERLGAPFITTPDGKGLINPHHPLYHGVFGFAGHASAKEVLQKKCDLIVTVGCSLGEFTTEVWSELLLNERLVHVEELEDNFLQSPMARLHVRGDLALIFAALLEHFRERRSMGAIERVMIPRGSSESKESGGVSPPQLLERLSKVLPSMVRFFADSGNSLAWAIHSLEVEDRRERNACFSGHELSPASVERRGKPRSWLNVTMEFGAMGWAIGAAIGAAMADRRGPVVCLTGDGSLLMNGQEMTVALSERLPVIFIVLNDSALGMVMHGQRLAGAEAIGFGLPEVDFAAVARAMGINAMTIASDAELESLDSRDFDLTDGPLLIDVRIDREVVPPMAVRTRAFKSA